MGIPTVVVKAEVTDVLIDGSNTVQAINVNAAQLMGRMAKMEGRVARVAKIQANISPKMGHATIVSSRAIGPVNATNRQKEGSRWGIGLPHWKAPRPRCYAY